MSKSRPPSMSHVPGFRSWLRAFMLTIYLIPMAFVINIIREFSYPFLLALDGLQEEHPIIMQITIVLVILWLGILWIVVPIFFLAHFYQFFWGEPDPTKPKWLPSKKSQIEGFWDWLVGVISLLVVVGCHLIYFSVASYARTKKIIIPEYLSEQEAQFFVVMFFFLAAHLYHGILSFQNFVKKIRANMQKRKP